MAIDAEKTETAETFYRSALDHLNQGGVAYMLGGAYALREYADLYRDTKDLDVFCKGGDYQRLLHCLIQAGYEPEITDANWLAKARCGEHYVDLIFGSANGLCPVDDTWLERAPATEIFGVPVKLVPVEEVLHSKLYVQDRSRYDGADVLHIFRKSGATLDWKYLLDRVDAHWELLLSMILQFRFVYPSERDAVPTWLMEELISRLQEQLTLPTPQQRICRGPLLTRIQYQVDITEWGYEWGFKQS